MKVAVYQAKSARGRIAENLATLERAARLAAAQEANLLVVQEMFLTGYGIGDQVRSLAESEDGPSRQRVSAICKEHGIAILYGYPERAGEMIYNAAALVDAGGHLITSYRKTHLFGPDEKRAFQAGHDLEVQKLGDVTVGIFICYDMELPEPARLLSLDGAKLIAVPTANFSPYDYVPTTLARARAMENQVYVAYANWCGTEGDLRCTGGSCLIDPQGRDIARAGNEECLLVAEIRDADPTATWAMNNYLGDRRPELYGMLSHE